MFSFFRFMDVYRISTTKQQNLIYITRGILLIRDFFLSKIRSTTNG